MSFKIPFIKPSFPSAEHLTEDYGKIRSNNWYTNFGPFEQQFRSEISHYVGQGSDSSTVNNATTGLLLASQAVCDSSKKYVIIPSFTFAAGAEIIISLGFTPVFIDILEDTWQPNIEQAAGFINENRNEIAGILLCNIFGVGNPDISKWEQLAQKKNIPLVIDSAAGFGSRYADGSLLGARGDCEVFSFHATKPFAIGEGGAVISKSNQLIAKIYELQNFGFDASKQVASIGLNGKMQELNCAIGLRQLADFESRITSRQSVLEQYRKRLEPNGYEFQPNSLDSSVCFASVLAPTAMIANEVLIRLKEARVEARNYYNPPLHKHKGLKEITANAGSLAVTEDFCSRIISLPVHDDMNVDGIEMICANLNYE